MFHQNLANAPVTQQEQEQSLYKETQKFESYAKAAEYLAALCRKHHHIKVICQFQDKTIKFSRTASPEDNEMIDSYKGKEGGYPLGLKIMLFNFASTKNRELNFLGTDIHGYHTKLTYLKAENMNDNHNNIQEELKSFNQYLVLANIPDCTLQEKRLFSK